MIDITEAALLADIIGRLERGEPLPPEHRRCAARAITNWMSSNRVTWTGAGRAGRPDDEWCLWAAISVALGLTKRGVTVDGACEAIAASRGLTFDQVKRAWKRYGKGARKLMERPGADTITWGKVVDFHLSRTVIRAE